MIRGLVASLVPALVLLAVGGLNNALTAAIFVVIGVLADAALGERGSHLAALAGFAAWIIILLTIALLASFAGGRNDNRRRRSGDGGGHIRRLQRTALGHLLRNTPRI